MVDVAVKEALPFTASFVPGAVVAIPMFPVTPSMEKIGRGTVEVEVVANLQAFTMFGMVVVDDEAKARSTPEKRS